LQVGSNASDTITLDLSGAKSDSTTLGVGSLQFDTAANADTSITALDTAIQTISTAQANLGAQQIRLQSTQQSLAVDAQNLTAANSQITDTDMAAEMATFTKENVLVQAGTAMLSQANQQSSLVLKLLQG
jgi:flagellin